MNNVINDRCIPNSSTVTDIMRAAMPGYGVQTDERSRQLLLPRRPRRSAVPQLCGAVRPRRRSLGGQPRPDTWTRTLPMPSHDLISRLSCRRMAPEGVLPAEACSGAARFGTSARAAYPRTRPRARLQGVRTESRPKRTVGGIGCVVQLAVT